MALAHSYDHARDERVVTLSTMARKHPFLLIRQLPQIMKILEEDATPRTSRPVPGLMLPPPRPSSADYIATTGGGGERVNVLFSHWGSLFGASLWKGVLDLFSAMPVAMVIAHQQTIQEGVGVWSLVKLYLGLLVAQGEEAAVGHMTAILEQLASWLDSLRQHDSKGYEAFILGQPIEASTTPPGEVIRSFLQPYRQVGQGFIDSPQAPIGGSRQSTGGGGGQ